MISYSHMSHPWPQQLQIQLVIDPHPCPLMTSACRTWSWILDLPAHSGQLHCQDVLLYSWQQVGSIHINIEGHMCRTCIPDESNEYQHDSCSEAILAKLVPKLPCACASVCANSYIHTHDVPVGERDSWMWTPTYMTISIGHEHPLWLCTSNL